MISTLYQHFIRVYSGFLNRLVETSHYCIRAELLICCKKRTLVAYSNDLESKLFLDHIFLKKTEISKPAYFALSSLLVVAKSTLNFFSSWAYHSCCSWTSLLPCWFEKQAAVKYKSAYLWKHASCKLFPFSKLYCFGLDKKRPFMKFETKLLASWLLC